MGDADIGNEFDKSAGSADSRTPKAMDGGNSPLTFDQLYTSYLDYLEKSKQAALAHIESADERNMIERRDHPKSKVEFVRDLNSMREPQRSRYIRGLTLGFEGDKAAWKDVAMEMIQNAISRTR